MKKSLKGESITMNLYGTQTKKNHYRKSKRVHTTRKYMYQAATSRQNNI